MDTDEILKPYANLFEETNEKDKDIYRFPYSTYEDSEEYEKEAEAFRELNKKYKFMLQIEGENQFDDGRYYKTYFSNNANKLRYIARKYIQEMWDYLLDETYDKKPKDLPFIYCPCDNNFEYSILLNFLTMCCGDGCETVVYCDLTNSDDESEDEDKDKVEQGLFPQFVYDIIKDHEDHQWLQGKYAHLNNIGKLNCRHDRLVLNFD